MKGARTKEEYLRGCKGAIASIYSSWRRDYHEWSETFEFARAGLGGSGRPVLGLSSNVLSSRGAQPNRKRFTVRRIIGAGDLWVTEYVLTYDGRPSYTVSIMEFLDRKVARETQYFGDPFEPGPSRAQWVERLP